MFQWFEDETFWTVLYPYIFSAERLEAGASQVERVLALAPPAGREVLDLCCGPGRHAVALAAHGLRVTAVDRSPFLLEKARKRALNAGVHVEFVEQDMREYVRPGAYGLAINLFTSLGYFDDRSDDLKVLANVQRSLAPGGALVVEMAGKEQLARDFQPTLSTKYPDGSVLVQRHEVVEDWSRLKNEWILVQDGRSLSFEFHTRIYSGQELRDLLGQAGFAHVQLFGALDGRPYSHDVERLVAVARKAAPGTR